VKINTFGVIFTILIIVFICSVGIEALYTKKFEYRSVDFESETVGIKLSSDGYPHLLGILGGGYYLHNISLPIFRNSKNPQYNIRDAFIGYFLVFLSYVSCGVLGYYGFSSFE